MTSFLRSTINKGQHQWYQILLMVTLLIRFFRSISRDETINSLSTLQDNIATTFNLSEIKTNFTRAVLVCLKNNFDYDD